MLLFFSEVMSYFNACDIRFSKHVGWFRTYLFIVNVQSDFENTGRASTEVSSGGPGDAFEEEGSGCQGKRSVHLSACFRKRPVTTEGAAGGERVVSPKQAQLMFQGDAISFIPSSDGLRACKRARGNLTNGRDPG
jgi:hypothetical protein